MKLVRFTKDGAMEETVMEAGHHYIDVALTDVIFFIRPNHIIPISDGGQCVAEVDFGHPELLFYLTEEKAVYEYYHDDGYEKDYENPKHRIQICVTK